MTLNQDDHLRVCDNVFAREFDGEIVLLDLAGGVYYGLDPLATEVWKAVATGKTLRELALDVLATYDVEPARLMNDLTTLATDWINKNLVEKAP